MSVALKEREKDGDSVGRERGVSLVVEVEDSETRSGRSVRRRSSTGVYPAIPVSGDSWDGVLR